MRHGKRAKGDCHSQESGAWFRARASVDFADGPNYGLRRR